MAARLIAGREPEPTAGIIDGQSVKTTESGGPRGYDAGKKVKGRKRVRHLSRTGGVRCLTLTDMQGDLLAGLVHDAGIQDRDGAPSVIASACECFPTLVHLFADGGHSGEKLKGAMEKADGAVIEIVKRPEGVTGFVVIARRWVVERTLAWFGRCRCLAKDREASIASSEARLLIASIRRTLTRVMDISTI